MSGDALGAAVAAWSTATAVNQKQGRKKIVAMLALAAWEEGQRLDRKARKMDDWLQKYPSTENEETLIAVLGECGAIHEALKGAKEVLACP